MNKQSDLERIRRAAFEDELEKIAVSEGAAARAVIGRAIKAMPRSTKTVRNELKTLIHNEMLGSHLAGRAKPTPEAMSYLNMIQKTIPKKGKVTMKRLFGQGRGSGGRSMGEYNISHAQSRRLKKWI